VTRRAPAACLLAGLFGAGLLVPTPAEGRPGSGQSYSSGSSGGSSSSRGSSSSSGSSSGGSSGSSYSSSGSGSTVVTSGNLSPAVFFIVFFGMIGFVLVQVFRDSYESRADREHWELQRRRAAESEERDRKTDYVALLRQKDPDFSLALFEDTARALFTQAHQARHDPAALARLAPYLDPLVRRSLQKRAPVGGQVGVVVVGALRLGHWRLNEMVGRFAVDAAFEANLILAQGGAQLVRETWTLERSARARTRPWEGVRSFGCPSCGAPLEQVAEELCQSCGQAVKPGRFDWTARSIEEGAGEKVAASLTGTVPERGTDRPTVVHPGLARAQASLLQDDPSALTNFEARLQLVFAELNAAWAAQDLRPVRAFLSAGLFATLQQQVEEYRRQGLVNAVKGAHIVRSQPARLVREARHDLLTLRVFGTGCDYTYRKAGGEVVGGDPDTQRPYSEYWTFIRGAQVRGAPRADKSCPRCGGPPAIGMEGNCEHCGALLASGDFDWVLSGIDQDDSYEG
jgi:predicted lipid-binding transport protein (Tim44 family)